MEAAAQAGNEASSASREAAPGPRHRLRWVLAAVALAAVGLAVLAAVYWHFSSAVVVPDRSDFPQGIRVEAVRPQRIVLERTTESERPGVLGLAWQAGHAIAGPIVRSEADTVTRRLSAVRGYLVPGLEVAVDSDVYTGDPGEGLGLPFTTVPIAGELGPMPAWRIPGVRDTWAIFVHGINSTRETGLRVAPQLHRDGLPTLVISYREDLGAPSSPDGYHHMGLTEWRDLQAAARYALAEGAKRLVLIGYSMGGSLVTQFMQKSPLADRVSALVLDAPALNWKRILSFNATEMGFPAFTSIPVQWAVGARIDADWDSLDALSHTEDLRLPILLFHGTDDDLIPISISDDFARELPAWVTYYRVPRAGHTLSWNVSPKLYDRRLSRFLASVLKGDGRRPEGRRRAGAKP